eukprot:3907968-Amphidinium_carterae.1
MEPTTGSIAMEIGTGGNTTELIEDALTLPTDPEGAGGAVCREKASCFWMHPVPEFSGGPLLDPQHRLGASEADPCLSPESLTDQRRPFQDRAADLPSCGNSLAAMPMNFLRVSISSMLAKRVPTIWIEAQTNSQALDGRGWHALPVWLRIMKD